MYLLTVVWMGDSGSRGIELGAVSHATRDAQLKSWRTIPALDRSNYFAELRDNTQWLEEMKPISAETVEALLGEPAAILLAREQQSTSRATRELKRKPKR
jgi:hypothetical protein